MGPRAVAPAAGNQEEADYEHAAIVVRARRGTRMSPSSARPFPITRAERPFLRRTARRLGPDEWPFGPGGIAVVLVRYLPWKVGATQTPSSWG